MSFSRPFIVAGTLLLAFAAPTGAAEFKDIESLTAAAKFLEGLRARGLEGRTLILSGVQQKGIVALVELYGETGEEIWDPTARTLVFAGSFGAMQDTKAGPYGASHAAPADGAHVLLAPVNFTPAILPYALGKVDRRSDDVALSHSLSKVFPLHGYELIGDAAGAWGAVKVAHRHGLEGLKKGAFYRLQITLVSGNISDLFVVPEGLTLIETRAVGKSWEGIFSAQGDAATVLVGSQAGTTLILDALEWSAR